LATPGKQTGTPNSGGDEDPEPRVAVKDSQDRWNNERAEADHQEGEEKKKEEETQGDSDKNKTSLLSSTKKKGRSTAGERPPLQRRSKRRRFSSPLSSDDETESDDESVISRYTPSKPYNVSTRPTLSLLSRSEGDVSNGKVELAGSQSSRRPIPKTTVIYERQSWAGEIIDEREVKQGRGKPRKQYLIQWEPSWVDGARLTVPESLQNWRGNKGSNCRR